MRGFAAELARLDFSQKLRQSREIFKQAKLAFEPERESTQNPRFREASDSDKRDDVYAVSHSGDGHSGDGHSGNGHSGNGHSGAGAVIDNSGEDAAGAVVDNSGEDAGGAVVDNSREDAAGAVVDNSGEDAADNSGEDVLGQAPASKIDVAEDKKSDHPVKDPPQAKNAGKQANMTEQDMFVQVWSKFCQYCPKGVVFDYGAVTCGNCGHKRTAMRVLRRT